MLVCVTKQNLHNTTFKVQPRVNSQWSPTSYRGRLFASNQKVGHFKSKQQQSAQKKQHRSESSRKPPKKRQFLRRSSPFNNTNNTTTQNSEQKPQTRLAQVSQQKAPTNTKKLKLKPFLQNKRIPPHYQSSAHNNRLNDNKNDDLFYLTQKNKIQRIPRNQVMNELKSNATPKLTVIGKSKSENTHKEHCENEDSTNDSINNNKFKQQNYDCQSFENSTPIYETYDKIEYAEFDRLSYPCYFYFYFTFFSIFARVSSCLYVCVGVC